MMTDRPKIWVPGDPMPPEVERFRFFNWITDTIAITSYEAASDRDILDLEGVKYVISIGELSPPQSVIGRKPIHFRYIEDCTSDIDGGDISDCVDAILSHSKAAKTLVHCAAGVSRSPGFVTLALCLDKGWDWDQSLAYVVERRDVAKVHPLVQSRLKEWLADRRR